ncbi:MAG: hypothetical protein FJZ04_02060 [Candidatus Moranbacteria bacterium]|nr:hypothetical protein [Candidatus Moranbacteria bacterium]
MNELIFDIETVGEDYDAIDKTTQKGLSRWIEREAKNRGEHKKMLANLKKGLSFSPLTGKIVAIGVLDVRQDKGVVYFQAPGAKISEFKKGGFKFKPQSEKEMLVNFWSGANRYQKFITFNGRSFDVPFIIARSAVNKVKITKDLMSNRYPSSQRPDAWHIDLLDQLTYYGATARGSLHLWCRALGIKSPKENGLDGENVTRYFNEGRYKDIARYNANDLVATKKLYEIWKEYMRPQS